MDCLNAVHKALNLGFFIFEDFDVDEYEYFEVRGFTLCCMDDFQCLDSVISTCQCQNFSVCCAPRYPYHNHKWIFNNVKMY